MTGVEVAVGCLVAWAWKKARRVGGRADGEVDYALDAVMDKVHELVAGKLEGNAELERLQEEADAGEDKPSKVTVKRVSDAVAAAVETDASFAAQLQDALAQLETAKLQAGTAVAGMYGLAVGGSLDLTAGDNSFVAGVANIKDGVHIGSKADGAVSGNTFAGPVAIQTGDHSRQDNRFDA